LSRETGTLMRRPVVMDGREFLDGVERPGVLEDSLDTGREAGSSTMTQFRCSSSFPLICRRLVGREGVASGVVAVSAISGL